MSSTENERPTMKDLKRYVTRKYAIDWLDFGIELGLQMYSLHDIEMNYRNCENCLQYTLAKWLDLNGDDDATWRTLEVALTNVKRVKVGLDPVAIDDVHGNGKDTANSSTLTVNLLCKHPVIKHHHVLVTA